jgi:hypothetical protein
MSGGAVLAIKLLDSNLEFGSTNCPTNSLECTTQGCCGKTTLDVWRQNSKLQIQRDVYHEVEEFICRMSF